MNGSSRVGTDLTVPASHVQERKIKATKIGAASSDRRLEVAEDVYAVRM